MSLAANVGLLFYIVANHQLDKWEKRDATPRIDYRNRHQRIIDVHCTSAKPRGEAVVKTDIKQAELSHDPVTGSPRQG
jgi:hypothetical protein